MLFLGDFENEYNKLLSHTHYKSEISEHTAIMVPHHGSAEKGNPNHAFYQAVNAKFAIVSSSLLSEKYHHPKMETLKAICKNNDAHADDLNGLNSQNILGWKSDKKSLQALTNCQGVQMFQTTHMNGKYMIKTSFGPDNENAEAILIH